MRAGISFSSAGCIYAAIFGRSTSLFSIYYVFIAFSISFLAWLLRRFYRSSTYTLPEIWGYGVQWPHFYIVFSNFSSLIWFSVRCIIVVLVRDESFLSFFYATRIPLLITFGPLLNDFVFIHNCYFVSQPLPLHIIMYCSLASLDDNYLAIPALPLILKWF